VVPDAPLRCAASLGDCEFHLAMPMPAVYELSWGGGVWQVVSGPGINPLANAKIV